jgi:hypothetical protein
LVIGGIAANIAWRQAAVARAKLKLDLFNERYQLYVCLWTFLTLVEGEADQLLTPMADLNNSLPKAAFLYGGEVGEYFEECLLNGKALRVAMRTLARPEATAPARESAEAEIVRLSLWHRNQLNELQSRFARHLNFEGWH